MSVFKRIDGPVKIAFLGCGNIAAKHARALKGFAGVEVFFASRQAGKAAEFSRKYAGVNFFGSYEEAIASADVNVVFITTPPDSHLVLAVAAMKAGKHVIVEKPAFFSATDFDTIDALRKEHGLQLMVAENYFYKPLLQRLRTVIPSGIIGEIKFLFFNATKTQVISGWRGESQVAGGGALYEGGIHWVNFLANAGLTVKKVTGFQPGGRNQPGEMEKSMQVVTEYAEGPVGTLLYSWEVNTLLKGLRLSRIYGTHGSITFESNGLFVFIRGKKWRLIFPGLKNIGGVQPMLADFFDALRTGREPSFSFAKAKQDLVLAEEIYKSAASA